LHPDDPGRICNLSMEKTKGWVKLSSTRSRR
jgi:hypothetical protein